LTASRSITLLHTSDVHVAGDHLSRQGLRLVVDVALERKVDAVLIAGDLFDSSRVPEAPVAEVLEQLSRLEVPVVVIPGNHDCIDEKSIYRRVDLRQAGDHVFFAGDPAGETLLFEDLSLAVWARGIEDHHPGHRPLEGYPGARLDLWDVVLTHGHLVTTPDDRYRSSQISSEEIAALDCDYLALGHWHRFVDVSQGQTTGAYCGSPSEGAGVVLASFDPEHGVRMERAGATTA
jgi:DNA repair exonuclease SbcCD nuclease subunit